MPEGWREEISFQDPDTKRAESRELTWLGCDLQLTEPDQDHFAATTLGEFLLQTESLHFLWYYPETPHWKAHSQSPFRSAPRGTEPDLQERSVQIFSFPTRSRQRERQRERPETHCLPFPSSKQLDTGQQPVMAGDRCGECFQMMAETNLHVCTLYHPEVTIHQCNFLVFKMRHKIKCSSWV